jgi:hypothetical protein
MRLLKLISLVFLFACNAPVKHSENKSVPKKEAKPAEVSNLDTLPNGQRLLDNTDSSLNLYYKEVVGSDTLTGGYITCYGVDNSMNYFYLRHGDTLHLLNKRERNVSAWSLGVLVKDFDRYFITAIDNGNGQPQTYQVFEKRSGKNLLGDKIEAWDYDRFNDSMLFLYDNHSVNLIDNYYIDRKKADSIFVYNIRSGKREGFRLLPTDSDVYYELKKITKHHIIISQKENGSGKENLIRYDR